MGETAADLLNDRLGLGLTGTSLVMTVLLVVTLIAQFRVSAYRPGLYWLVVVLVSVVGTLITDNLTDNLGVPLELTTAVFTVALAAAFLLWFRSEGALSIRSIDTPRREALLGGGAAHLRAGHGCRRPAGEAAAAGLRGGGAAVRPRDRGGYRVIEVDLAVGRVGEVHGV